MLKLRGLGLIALLVLSGVTVTASPVFSPTSTTFTVTNKTESHNPPLVFQNSPASPNLPKAPPKPSKVPIKPIHVP